MGFFDELKSKFGSRRLNVHARFELLQAAISGTMSEVYQARDRKTGEIVALKILDKEKTEALYKRVKNVQREAEGSMAMKFEHPYIVKTLEHGLTTTGSQYLVMEYLSGTGLNNVLTIKGDLMAGARVKYLKQVAESLQYVHEKRYIHRDICPRNLIFNEDFTILKLTDFGLSVPAEGAFLEPGNRTGTPNYMAPELVRRKKTDQRLDVFAFGVTAYELCTRELPWPSGNTGMAAMAHDQAPEDIRKFRPQINERLAKAIHSCIEPDVSKRCSSMKHFLYLIKKVENEDGE
jgi:eukaryotic-like serine/threonine-protein kinase